MLCTIYFGLGILGTQFLAETTENLGFDKKEEISSQSTVNKQNNITKISIYKNTNSVDRSYDVTEETFWDFKDYNDLELLTLKEENEKSEFYKIFKKLDFINYVERPILNPEYSIILHKENNDTIFLNISLDKGYFSTKKKMFIDNDRNILKYLKNRKFLSKHTEYIIRR